MGAILIRLERIGLEVKESFSLQQWRGGGGGGFKSAKKWKGGEGRSILFILPFSLILYSFCIVNPTCHLKADYEQSLSFGKVCYPEKKILLVVHLK